MNLPPNAVSDGGNGVIHMGLLNIIRRMALREKQSIREISRRTGLSRNTIAKYLSAGTIEPTFTAPERPSKLDPYADKLAGWLKTEAGRSRKQRRTLKQLHADLVVLGFTGSYGRVAAFARDWRAEQQKAGRGIFVPLSFRPGEAFQFDWSEDYAVVGGERTKLQVAHIKLSHSRAFLVRAYLLQTHEMLFDAHWHGFRVFGGVPGRGIYDNMKTAVDRVGRGKERQVNIRFLAMTNHYVFAPEFCNPAAGWEKGQLENQVGLVRERFFTPRLRVKSLEELNRWLMDKCVVGGSVYVVTHSTAYSSDGELSSDQVSYIRNTMISIPAISLIVSTIAVLFFKVPEYKVVEKVDNDEPFSETEVSEPFKSEPTTSEISRD